MSICNGCSWRMYLILKCGSIVYYVFFFFKQKTAYEMCISDWSSDVCSSDLGESAVFCDRDFLDYDVLGSDIDYSDRSSVEKVVDYFTSLYARTDEKHDQAAFEKGVPAERRYTGRGIEVGHIFFFGTKYSEPLGAFVTTPDDGSVPVHDR